MRRCSPGAAIVAPRSCSPPARTSPDKQARSRVCTTCRPDVAGSEGRGGPRQGDAELPALPRGDARDRDDAGSDAAARGPAVEKEFGILGDGKIGEVAREIVRAPRTQMPATGRAGAHREDRRARCTASGRTPSPAAVRNPSRISSSARRRSSPAFRDESAAAVDCRTVSAAISSEPGPLEAIALYDRLLAEVPALRAQRPGALPEGARVRRARPHRRGHEGRWSSSSPRIPHSRYYRRSAVPARRVLLHAQEVPRRRERLRGDHQPSARRPSTTSSRSTSSAGRSTSRTSTRRPCTGTSRCSTTRFRSATTSIRQHEEDDERRVADTFRVISLSFSNLGGPEVVQRVLRDERPPQLRGSRLRATSASSTSRSCATTTRPRPTRRSSRSTRSTASSPHFSMRVIEIYDAGRLPEAGARVEEGLRDAATGCRPNTGATSTSAESPEVLSYLKSNLKDLANHYHAQYQNAELGRRRSPRTTPRRCAGTASSSLRSRTTPESPPINYQLADLLLENKDFAGAAREYERTAYDYPAHDEAAGRGLRRDLRAPRAPEGRRAPSKPKPARRDTVDELAQVRRHLPGARARAPRCSVRPRDDLYEHEGFPPARTAARRS